MPVRLKTVTFPDGTGSIGLAPGWKIDDQKRDSILLSGPDRASMRLGQYGTTVQPAAVQFGAENYFTVVQNLSDPVTATAAYVEQAGRRAGKPLRLRVLEVKPVSGGGGGSNAVMMHYRIEGAVVEEGYGFFAAGPVGSGMGQLYSSFATAPPAAFKKHFVTMLAIWRSRRTNFGHAAFTETPAEVALKMRTLQEHGKEVRKLL
jgi:hypothetical protein